MVIFKLKRRIRYVCSVHGNKYVKYSFIDNGILLTTDEIKRMDFEKYGDNKATIIPYKYCVIMKT